MTDPSNPSSHEPTSPPPAASTPPAYSPSTPSYSSAPAAGGKYNTLAIVGFILAFFVAIAGLIVSIIARNQIKQSGEQGAGLALAGIIISVVSLIIGIISTIVIIAGSIAAASYSSY